MSEIRLVLIRGLPGSGKSTLAETRFKDFFHLEADMYFLDFHGNYEYNSLYISEAHEWCEITAQVLLNSGYKVVVSNTFTELWEMNAYLNLVNRDELQITEASGNWKNIHNVSEEKIQMMQERWEALPYEDWEYMEPINE